VKISTFHLLGIPDQLAITLALLGLILFLAPYIEGADFGILRVPRFSEPLRRTFKRLGPLLLLVPLTLFVPVWPERPAASLVSTPEVATGPASVWDEENAHVVMIQSRDTKNHNEWLAAGVVVAASGPDLYVATAAHIIRDPDLGSSERRLLVQVYRRPNEWLPARVVSAYRIVDLALLQVSSSTKPFDRHLTTPVTAASPSTIHRGDDLFPIGYTGGELWHRSVTPAKAATVSGGAVRFEDLTVGPGTAGGGLFDACGRLLGVVIEDSPPVARAITIDEVLNALTAPNPPAPIIVTVSGAPCSNRLRP